MTELVIQALRRRTNHHGLVIVREDTLLGELRVSSEVLRTAIQNLEESRALEILSPFPFLVLKWSGTQLNASEKGRNHGHSATPRYSSYSLNQESIDESIALKAIGQYGDELLEEILTTLGESDPTTFRGVLKHYPAATIRAVLDRVRSTPPESFRKSKTALFRYLLAKRKHSHP